jgi:hypothetical protein
MRDGARNLQLAAAVCCTVVLVACSAQPVASRATADGAGAAAVESDTTGRSGVLVGSGHEATVAGDSTARGGVFVGSGH